jgi:L-asparaginase
LSKKSKILIIYTGGTIGMTRGDDGYLNAYGFDDFFEYIPQTTKEYISNSNNYSSQKAKRLSDKNRLFLEINNRDIILIKVKELKAIDSSNLSIKNIKKIASILFKSYNKYDGFIVICGTDTMSYLSNAVSLMLLNINKPILFTGSMTPIRDSNSDGVNNMMTSILVAGYNASGLKNIKMVAVVFGDKIIDARRVIKQDSQKVDAFSSPNYPLIGEVKNRIILNVPKSIYSKNKKIVLRENLSDNIAVIYFHPFMSLSQFKLILTNKNIDGIVIMGYGTGAIKESKEIYKLIKKSIKMNKYIMIISQCHSGGTNLTKYSSSKELIKLGVIDGGNKTVQSAVSELSIMIANS